MYEDQVNKGAELLSKQVGPYWFEAVRTDTLDLNSTYDCVLAQLFTHYYVGCRALWPDAAWGSVDFKVTSLEHDELAEAHSFNMPDPRFAEMSEHEADIAMAALQEAWINKIEELRGSFASHP